MKPKPSRLQLSRDGYSDPPSPSPSGHAERKVNDGRAEWLVSGVLSDGTPTTGRNLALQRGPEWALLGSNQ